MKDINKEIRNLTESANNLNEQVGDVAGPTPPKQSPYDVPTKHPCPDPPCDDPPYVECPECPPCDASEGTCRHMRVDGVWLCNDGFGWFVCEYQGPIDDTPRPTYQHKPDDGWEEHEFQQWVENWVQDFLDSLDFANRQLIKFSDFPSEPTCGDAGSSLKCYEEWQRYFWEVLAWIIRTMWGQYQQWLKGGLFGWGAHPDGTFWEWVQEQDWWQDLWGEDPPSWWPEGWDWPPQPPWA